MRTPSLTHRFLVLLGVLLAIASGARAGAIVQSAIGKGSVRIVISLDRPAIYRVTNDSRSSRRVVIDLSCSPDGATIAGRSLPSSFVTGMKLEENGGKLRLLLDTDRAVQITDSSLTSPPRVVLDITESQAPRFPQLASAASLAPRSKGAPAAPVARTKPKPSSPAPIPVSSRRSKPVVVIDPGHGGSHKGGSATIGGRKVFEKEITLAIAFKVEKLFQRDGHYDVRLTRRDDRYVGLLERTQRAEMLEGDLFVSLHTNAVTGAAASRARGLELWVWSPSASPRAAAQRVDEIENNDGSVRLARPLLSRMMTDALQGQALESRRLATAFERSFNRESSIRANYRGIDSARFKVLENYSMPSVLIEYGFLTHSAESKRLKDPAYQQMLAQRTFDGIVAYLQMVESEGRKHRELARK